MPRQSHSPPPHPSSPAPRPSLSPSPRWEEGRGEGQASPPPSALLALRVLAPIDAANVQRDALLRWLLLAPLVVALPARFLLPAVAARAGELLGVDLLPYFEPMLGMALLLVGPTLVGMIVGFLLLDQRDDGTLTALRVTPLPLRAYLTYRLAAPMAVALLLTLATLPLAGLADLALGPAGLLLAALAAAPLAPLQALALAAFADNKVQGFALTKALGLLLVAPAIAYFVQGPWQALLALAPTYWPAWVYWRLQAGDLGPALWLTLLAGFAYQAFLIAILLRRLDRALLP